MATEAQKRAKAKYAKEHVKQVVVRFYPKDAELLEWVRSHGGSTYLKELAQREMEGR